MRYERGSCRIWRVRLGMAFAIVDGGGEEGMCESGGARWDVGWVWKVCGSLSLVFVYKECKMMG